MTVDWVARSRNLNIEVRNFIDGRWSSNAGGRLLKKLSPRDGTLLCQFQESDLRETHRAVAAAKVAHGDGRWSRLPVQKRKEILFRLAMLIEQNREKLALLESLDVGKPIREAFGFDVPSAAAAIRFNAEAADKVYGQVYVANERGISYQLLRPVGVVAGIVGWNFPLALAAKKIGAALAAGNCLVLKPSELTSFSAGRIAELALEAGLPTGVLNVIHGGPEVGTFLANHNDVNLITFTGSTSTGRKILAASGASNMKRVILECGGKAPNIVFKDCPTLEAVAEGVANRAFWNQGEVCTASSRLLVNEDIKDDLMSALLERTKTIRQGDPLSDATSFGPLVSEAHKNKVEGYIESGIQEGARLVFRSEAPPPHPLGFYVSPTIFDEVNSAQKIAREEIFGPVLSVITFRDEDEAIRIANETIYGLSAILWTKDVGRAIRVSSAIDAGIVVVNSTDRPTGAPGIGVLPVGGHKQSGIGTEGGLEGLVEFTRKSVVQLFT